MVEVVVEVTMVCYRQVRIPPKRRDDAGPASSLRVPLKADCHPQNIGSQPSTSDCRQLNCQPGERLVHDNISQKPKKRERERTQKGSVLVELNRVKFLKSSLEK